jgi:hypothetical protein
MLKIFDDIKVMVQLFLQMSHFICNVLPFQSVIFFNNEFVVERNSFINSKEALIFWNALLTLINVVGILCNVTDKFENAFESNSGGNNELEFMINEVKSSFVDVIWLIKELKLFKSKSSILTRLVKFCIFLMPADIILIFVEVK